MTLDLAVVMPVYNEEECIVGVVESWRAMLSKLGITFRIIVLNDGSKDSTRQSLGEFASDPNIEVVDKPNSGHGPTILVGYNKAAEVASWVFQCDSDDEMKADAFPPLWERRERYDAIFGIRSGREQNIGRSFISLCSRLTVGFLFAPGVRDVNVPYRLIRSDLLRQLLPQIPADTFAPNVIISGALAKAHAHIANVPVAHEGRRTGTISIVKWKLWKAAMRSFFQTLRCRPRIRIKRRSK
jgi:glycosyltransferase involved in cell wall biosynthesis